MPGCHRNEVFIDDVRGRQTAFLVGEQKHSGHYRAKSISGLPYGISDLEPFTKSVERLSEIVGACVRRNDVHVGLDLGPKCLRRLSLVRGQFGEADKALSEKTQLRIGSMPLLVFGGARLDHLGIVEPR